MGHRQLGLFRQIASEKVERAFVQCSIAVLALALITVASSLLHFNFTTASLLYVIVIVLLARLGDFVPSVVVSIVAALLLAVLAPPAYSFRIDDSLDVVALLAFLVTAMIIARLVSRLRTMSEEALSSVNRKLIDAEERVRSRIGKELHDDIEQRLALLAVKVAQVSGNGFGPEGKKSLDGLPEQASRIATDVQALAYELRPYTLHYLGIAAVIKSLCEKFGEQHNVEIRFKSHDLPDDLPLDISLSLVRVLEEALANSAKHSGARLCEVEFSRSSEAIHLTIRDSGVGFNPKRAIEGPGLGLISMQERMKLVNGEFLVDSRPKTGTTIYARVPLQLTY